MVVGYDGSGHARRALAHAVGRLQPNGRLVVVYGYGEIPGQLGPLKSAQALEEQERLGQETLECMSSDCAEVLAGIGYETELLARPAAEALVEAARDHRASEIVVGTRGFGDARTWLGSVSHELLRVADRPVVVVPPEERSAGAERQPLHAEARVHTPRRHGSPS